MTDRPAARPRGERRATTRGAARRHNRQTYLRDVDAEEDAVVPEHTARAARAGPDAVVLALGLGTRAESVVDPPAVVILVRRDERHERAAQPLERVGRRADIAERERRCVRDEPAPSAVGHDEPRDKGALDLRRGERERRRGARVTATHTYFRRSSTRSSPAARLPLLLMSARGPRTRTRTHAAHARTRARARKHTGYERQGATW